MALTGQRRSSAENELSLQRWKCSAFPQKANGGWQAQGGPPPWASWRGFWNCGPSNRQPASSGNHAFDEYRADTLRRLEDEQKEFGAFLERLRFAAQLVWTLASWIALRM